MHAWCYQPTYEELKRQLPIMYILLTRGYQPTYEELKPLSPLLAPFFPARYQPTYEELKQTLLELQTAYGRVTSLPMRN